VKINPDGSFTYKKTTTFTGLDSLNYVAKDVDTTRTSNVGTVAILVK
jgi:hypothetical protein